jgi:hypothetical protein
VDQGRQFRLSESVIIVAQLEEMVIYYEDVEDGFNVSEVAPDGSIATPGFEQWTIVDAIQHLLAFPYVHSPRVCVLSSLTGKVRPQPVIGLAEKNLVRSIQQ